MIGKIKKYLIQEFYQIEGAGLYKAERIITFLYWQQKGIVKAIFLKKRLGYANSFGISNRDQHNIPCTYLFFHGYSSLNFIKIIL